MFRASTNDNLSSSVLKGGDNFKNVLKSPISFSFNDKLFIDTPVVKLISFFLFFITPIDFAEEICEI